MRSVLLALAAFTLVSAAPDAARTSSASIARRGLTSFAPILARQPITVDNALWKPVKSSAAWTAIIRARPAQRQSARWAYARSLIGEGLGAEAIGVLDVMGQDDPDLMLVDVFRLARGAAFALAGRKSEALAELLVPGLATNPEACVWRTPLLFESALAEQALSDWQCARPALAMRSVQQRERLMLTAAKAALDAGSPATALNWIKGVTDRNPRANFIRGRAYLALGDAQAGMPRLAQAKHSRSQEEQVDSEVSEIEFAVAHGAIRDDKALARLEALRFRWRGGTLEKRALMLAYKINERRGNERAALVAGATLLRYLAVGAEGAALTANIRQTLAKALSPTSNLPIDQAAGLYWDFRDLAPGGAEGDFLVSQLADRLQAAGLTARAGNLLQHQLYARAQDISQGPLSIRVATLHILSGRPDRALSVIRNTDGIRYPAEMSADRRKIEAVALAHLGRLDEARATLQDVPGGYLIEQEIFWRNHDWQRTAAAEIAIPHNSGRLSEVNQAILLRRAVALAMLGREDDLAALRLRYGPAFANLPSEAAFKLLTEPTATLNPALIASAMAQIPTASPAGDIALLLEARPSAQVISGSAAKPSAPAGAKSSSTTKPRQKT